MGGLLANLMTGNPMGQLNQALAGPQPGQGAPAPAAGGGGQPGAAAPPGGPALPNAQATQSPPDLAQLYFKLERSQQLGDSLNRHMALMAGGFKGPPGGAQQIMQGMTGGGSQDPGALLQNLLMMRQQQAMMGAPAPPGVNPQYWAILPPDARAKVAGDIITQQAGIGGPPVTQEMQRGKQVYMSQHGITDPNDSAIPNYYKYPDQYQTHTEVEGQKAKEVSATQNNFQDAVQGYDLQLSNINQLLDPANKQYINEFVGPYQSKFKPTGELSPQAQALKKIYDTTMAAQFGSAVQDFPGSRISTKELVADAPSKSSMGLEQGADSFLKATEQYRDQVLNHRTNLFGKAQQFGNPGLSDAEYDKYMNPIYKEGGSMGSDAPVNRPAPVAIQSPGDIANLEPGRKIILPDKSTGYVVHQPSDIAKLPHGAKYIIPGGPDAGKIDTAP
jgi:hypothetical protein